MRGLLLIGLLMGIALMAYLWAQNTSAISKANKDVLPEVNQFSGRDMESGDPAYQTAELEAVENGQRLTGVRVVSVRPNGAYEKYFGLKPNDTIISVEYQAFTTPLKGKELEDAKLEVFNAFQKQGTVTVLRDKQQMTLPGTGADSKNPTATLQNQLDATQTVPR
jgi:hypothetical protein